MSKIFVDGIKTPFAGLLKTLPVTDHKTGEKKDVPYLPWPRALALAGRPKQDVIYFDGTPYLELFGGAIVGVKQEYITKEGEIITQDTYLPVLANNNKPIPFARIDPRDVTDTINRCRAKSAATVTGVGLSIFANGQTNTIEFLKKLGVTPVSDLSTVEPLTVKKPGKSTFIDWASAVAAARITDETFTWSIGWHSVLDTKTGDYRTLPVMRVGRGWAVSVTVKYKGLTHTEVLPIMGTLEVEVSGGEKKKLDHQSLENPTVHDWHRATMRCLVKAIAVHAGYGLNVYANEDVESLHVDPVGRKPDVDPPAATAAGENPPKADAQPAVDPAQDQATRKQLAEELSLALTAKKKDTASFLTWIGQPADTALASLSVTDLRRGLAALVNVQPSNLTH
jgi:hypothetical protein